MSSKCKVIFQAWTEHDQSIAGAKKTNIRAYGACPQRAHTWEQANLVWLTTIRFHFRTYRGKSHQALILKSCRNLISETWGNEGREKSFPDLVRNICWNGRCLVWTGCTGCEETGVKAWGAPHRGHSLGFLPMMGQHDMMSVLSRSWEMPCIKLSYRRIKCTNRVLSFKFASEF